MLAWARQHNQKRLVAKPRWRRKWFRRRLGLGGLGLMELRLFPASGPNPFYEAPAARPSQDVRLQEVDRVGESVLHQFQLARQVVNAAMGYSLVPFTPPMPPPPAQQAYIAHLVGRGFADDSLCWPRPVRASVRRQGNAPLIGLYRDQCAAPAPAPGPLRGRAYRDSQAMPPPQALHDAFSEHLNVAAPPYIPPTAEPSPFPEE